MNSKERALDHKCPNCGGKIVFTPESGKWHCEHCKSDFDLETLQKYNNASSEENNKSDESANVDISYVEYHCKNCGAKIVADEQTASTFCVYCGNTAILKSKLSGKFAPSKIIPFSKSKDEALEAFRSLNKGRPLMPKLFNKKENIEKISGVYIPFWLYTIKTNGTLEGNCKKISTWVSGEYSYTKTDVYDVQREVDMVFKRVPVDGSTRFDNDIMNTIEPYDYSKLVNYNHAYLSGFLAEKYDVESSTAEVEAKDRTLNSTKNTLNSSLATYSIKTIRNENISQEISEVEYVLLPVWMVNVKYNGQFYTFAMNAQTGEFVGNIPVDRVKAIMFYAAIFILVAALVTFIAYLAY